MTRSDWFYLTVGIIGLIVAVLANLAVGAGPSLVDAVVVHDRADEIVRHHFCDADDGKQLFEQVVFKEWGDGEAAGRCFAWRMSESGSARQIPHTAFPYTTVGGNKRLIFLDDRTSAVSVLRVVDVGAYSRLWTTWDIEAHDRRAWPTDKRRELGALVRRQ